MSEGVYSVVPQPMKFTQVSLDIYLSMGSVKRLALIPSLKHVGFLLRHDVKEKAKKHIGKINLDY